MTHTAIILLAGMGSRLSPLTDNTHKALIKIGSQTILERQIAQLKQNNITHLRLVLGHRAKDIQAYMNQHDNFGLNIAYLSNPIYEQTNTAYSLGLAIQDFNESFLLLDGDVVLDDKLMSELAAQSTTTLLSDTNKSKLNAEAVKFSVNHQNQIIEIGKDIPLNESHGESIGVGLYQKDWCNKLKTTIENAIKDKNNWKWYYEDAMQQILKTNQAPSPLIIKSTQDLNWVEIDDHEDFKVALQLFG